jgi:hypothetical protein
MKQIISKQLRFLTKNLLLPAVILLLFNPGLSAGFYLLDTFDDDTHMNPPNGPEIGTAIYGGSASHTVINYSGDLRLFSKDADINGGILISYIPFASPDVVEVRYQILIESGGSLIGQNAFTQNMILSPGGTNIHMDWTNTKEWVFRINIPGPDPPAINTGLTWVEDTYYIINWYIDTVNDTVSVDMFDGMAGILGTTSISYNATGFSHMSFSSNFTTTGSQRIDDVSIGRLCGGPCTWYVDDSAVGGNNGQNWTDAFTKLQDALAMAAPGDKIKVAGGTYRPDRGGGQTLFDITATFSLMDDLVIEGGYAGFGEPDPNARDVEGYETILSGDLKGDDGPNFTNNSDNSHHVVSANISSGGAVLDGFTVTAGNAVGLNPTGQGGGIYIGSGSPILVNCTFIRNKAVRGGGASNSHYFADDPSFISCKFIGNSADNAGGGMESQGGEPSLTNCVFSGNTSAGGGGGLLNMGNSIATMTNCTLSGNSAVNGGGIFNDWATASVEVLNCILWSNSDSGGTDESAQIHISMGTVSVDYTCVQGLSGGLGGTGNIGDDPLFVDADGADNVVGTEDDDVHLSEGSPCIDTGHPAVQYEDIDGSRNDMGAYGGQFGEMTEPPVYTGTGFIITNIGELPTTEIGRDANEPNVGLANVEPDVATLFGVHQYKDAPFSGTARVHGQFGLYDDVDFYQIMWAKWVDGNEPAPEDYAILNDEKGALQLGKVRWYEDANGWNHEYVRMGPKTIDGRDYLYQYNSPLDGSIWSNYDLRIRWNMRSCESGLYTITYKAYRWADPCETTLVDVNLPPTDGWDHVILLIDNNPVTATIHNVRYDPNEGNPNYDPCTDGLIEECAIIGLTDVNENLRFTITAKHATGYLRKWVLDAVYGKNRYAGVIASDSYTPVSPPYWDGVQEQEFQSEDSSSLDPWQRCAYQFRLRAWGRATNGSDYVYYDIFSDHYYLDFGETTCMRADIDGSGMVDLRDVAELFDNYLETCGL